MGVQAPVIVPKYSFISPPAVPKVLQGRAILRSSMMEQLVKVLQENSSKTSKKTPQKPQRKLLKNLQENSQGPPRKLLKIKTSDPSSSVKMLTVQSIMILLEELLLT